MEFTGMAALRAFGMPASQAALVMLSQRLLASGMTILMAGAILTVLRVASLVQPRSTS